MPPPAETKEPAQPKDKSQTESVKPKENMQLLEIPAPEVLKEVGAASEKEALAPRRGERERTLTEKGKGFRSDKLNALLGKFDRVYQHWKVEAKDTKKGIINDATFDTLQDNVDGLEKYSKDLNEMYNEYRKLEVPANNLRRRIDKCNQVTENLVHNAKILIQETGEDLLDWPEVSSVFDSTTVSSLCLPVLDQSFPRQAQPKEPNDASELPATKAKANIQVHDDDGRHVGFSAESNVAQQRPLPPQVVKTPE